MHQPIDMDLDHYLRIYGEFFVFDIYAPSGWAHATRHCYVASVYPYALQWVYRRIERFYGYISIK